MNIRPRCCPLWLSSLLSLGLAWAVSGADLTVPESVVFERGVEFSNPDNQHLQLNLARPKTGNGPFPSIVCIHGGGFRAGTREGSDHLIPSLEKTEVWKRGGTGFAFLWLCRGLGLLV